MIGILSRRSPRQARWAARATSLGLGIALATLVRAPAEPTPISEGAQRACAVGIDAARRLGIAWDRSLEGNGYASGLKQALIHADQAKIDSLLQERGYDKGFTVAIVLRGLVSTNGQITISMRGWKAEHKDDLIADADFDVRALLSPDQTALLTDERASSRYNFTGLAQRYIYDGKQSIDQTFLFENITPIRRQFVLGGISGGVGPYQLRLMSLRQHGIPTIDNPGILDTFAARQSSGFAIPDFNNNFVQVDNRRLQPDQKAKVGVATLTLIDATFRPLKYGIATKEEDTSSASGQRPASPPCDV